MIIVNDLEYIEKNIISTAITIGNFDGVHIGHQALISKTVKSAKEINASSLAITFNPHPAQIIKKSISLKLINSYEQKNSAN